MSDDDDTPECLFFMRRAEFVPEISDEEFKSVSESLNKNNIILTKKIDPSSASGKRTRAKNASLKKIPAETKESLKDDLLSSDKSLISAAAKRRLKKQENELASELRLIEAANKQVLAATDKAISVNDIEEICVDESENVSIVLTISYMSEIRRLRCYENEKFATIFPRVADLLKLKASEILLCLREQNIKVNDTPKSLNITLSDTIECIPVKGDESIQINSGDRIKLYFQSSDSKEKINLLAHKLQKLGEIMKKYSELRTIPLNQLIFEFDGERIQGTETPEDLDMESGNCIDVKVIVPDPKTRAVPEPKTKTAPEPETKISRRLRRNATRRSPRNVDPVIIVDDDSSNSDILMCD